MLRRKDGGGTGPMTGGGFLAAKSGRDKTSRANDASDGVTQALCLPGRDSDLPIKGWEPGRGAGTRVCRVETRLDAFRSGPKSREGITSPSHPALSAWCEAGRKASTRVSTRQTESPRHDDDSSRGIACRVETLTS